LHASYTQDITRIRLGASEVLVNGRTMKVVNIPSTKMMKKVTRKFLARHPGAMRSIEPQMRNCASGDLEIPGSMRCIVPE